MTAQEAITPAQREVEDAIFELTTQYKIMRYFEMSQVSEKLAGGLAGPVPYNELTASYDQMMGRADYFWMQQHYYQFKRDIREGADRLVAEMKARAQEGDTEVPNEKIKDCIDKATYSAWLAFRLNAVRESNDYVSRNGATTPPDEDEQSSDSEDEVDDEVSKSNLEALQLQDYNRYVFDYERTGYVGKHLRDNGWTLEWVQYMCKIRAQFGSRPHDYVVSKTNLKWVADGLKTFFGLDYYDKLLRSPTRKCDVYRLVYVVNLVAARLHGIDAAEKEITSAAGQELMTPEEYRAQMDEEPATTTSNAKAGGSNKPGTDEPPNIPKEFWNHWKARKMKCFSPNCPYFINEDEQFGGFCCRKCHYRFRYKVTAAKEKHRKFCQKREAPKGTPVAPMVIPIDPMEPQWATWDRRDENMQREHHETRNAELREKAKKTGLDNASASSKGESHRGQTQQSKAELDAKSEQLRKKLVQSHLFRGKQQQQAAPASAGSTEVPPWQKEANTKRERERSQDAKKKEETTRT